MIRHLPTMGYSGLTIILSNPSRNDKNTLINPETTAGWFLDNECLYPHLNRYQCDIRLAEDHSPLVGGTKAILLLGQFAHSKYTQLLTTLDENRGSPTVVNGITCISSFTPQDAIDPMDFETRLNSEVKTIDDAEFSEDNLSELLESKGRGRTARSNYRFWLKHDVGKVIQILQNNGRVPSHGFEPRFHLWPSAETVINLLSTIKGQDFFFDMETDFISAHMRCFAFSFGNNPEDVYVVPCLTTDYKLAYDHFPNILRALSICIRDNTMVAHNGAHFDFLVLALRYGISIGAKVYDTLVSMNRTYPTLEKSLGHCVSLETFEPYHKNEGVHTYRNLQQAEQLYTYCGKDVFTMFLVKRAQDKRAAADEGLKQSIALANASIKPYLTTSILGIHYSETERAAWVHNSDRLLTQYMRIMKCLHGDGVQALISNQKCAKYFHEQLEYSVMLTTPKGGASLKEDALLKLALKYKNPVITFLIKYRQRKLQSSTLQFKPWWI